MIFFILLLCLSCESASAVPRDSESIGKEVAIDRHLQDDEEFELTTYELIEYGRKLFTANWTIQEGAGRPRTKGTGSALSSLNNPLVGKRAFNRISGPDANSCAGCHNSPFGIPGGGGDFVGNVFVLAQRFDFASFDTKDKLATSGTKDEKGNSVNLQNIGNSRSTTGLFGAGYIEMLAREITEDLQSIRDDMKRGETSLLISKGVSFGKITRQSDGLWDVSKVEGLPYKSLISPTALNPPSLIIRPWHQSGSVISLREFTNNALNQHHGMQSVERFGLGDNDGDGYRKEITRADVTALTLFQATLPVPVQEVSDSYTVSRAVKNGEIIFNDIGCANCHIPALPLYKKSWVYTEPNPFNPPSNLRIGETETIYVDLTDNNLSQPRLIPESQNADLIMVPLYSDLKLHDITSKNSDLNKEPLDMNRKFSSPSFLKGNSKFLTKRLWGTANQPPYFHHGLFTTLREAVLAHNGEAFTSKQSFKNLSNDDKNALIEFLKSLKVLPLEK